MKSGICREGIPGRRKAQSRKVGMNTLCVGAPRGLAWGQRRRSGVWWVQKGEGSTGLKVGEFGFSHSGEEHRSAHPLRARQPWASPCTCTCQVTFLLLPLCQWSQDPSLIGLLPWLHERMFLSIWAVGPVRGCYLYVYGVCVYVCVLLDLLKKLLYTWKSSHTDPQKQ